jgi:cardiolipin synthase (CMP-forming)
VRSYIYFVERPGFPVCLLPGLPLSLPNLITMARILCVPLIVWTITSGHMLPAFLLFLAAGISDAVDGFLAKRFNMATELGALLDPLADKALIVSIYVALGFTEALPRWMVILVVSRDILIVGGFLLAMLIDRPMPVRPHPVSKLNTVAQITLAAVTLGSLGLNFDAGWALPILMALVTILTLLSIGFYVAEWIRHFGTNGAAR